MNEADSVSCWVWTQTAGTETIVKQQNGNPVTDQKSGVSFIITDKRQTSSINHGFPTQLNTFLSSLCKLATVLILVAVFGLGLSTNAPVHYHYTNGILGVRCGGEDYDGNYMIYWYALISLNFLH